MANAASQYNYKLAVDAGQTAYNRYLKDNPGQVNAAKEHAAGKFDERFNDLEGKRKELEKPSKRDPNKPLLVYDPFNRLTNPVRIDTPAPDYSSILNMANKYAVESESTYPSNYSARDPITTSSVLSAQDQTMQAFEAYIVGMGWQELQGLKAHLFSYRDAMKRQPVSLERNRKVQEANLQIETIIRKLSTMKPDPVQQSVSERPQLRPPIAYVRPTESSYQRCLALQAQGAKILCHPPGESTRPPASGDTPPGGAQTLLPPLVQPTGITVSTMPIVDTGNEGVRAELNAPILDLYSVYADRGYEREAAAIQGETARLLDDIKQRQEYRVSVPHASPVTPVTSQPSQQQVVVATETDYTLQPMPTMPSPVKTVSLEAAATGQQVASGPVVMSAGASNVPAAVNWWLLGGLGVAALVFFGGKVRKGKK